VARMRRASMRRSAAFMASSMRSATGAIRLGGAAWAPRPDAKVGFFSPQGGPRRILGIWSSGLPNGPSAPGRLLRPAIGLVSE
jgi:hypothetical protein